jgi:hypothetical protein
MRVRIIKNWTEPDLLRQTPERSGRWEEFQFLLEDDGQPFDWLVALNNRFAADLQVRMPRDRVWVLMQEPFVPGFTDWMDRDLEAFQLVLSSHRPRRCLDWRRSHPAVAWHVNRSHDELCRIGPGPKPRLASWVCGSARALPGHRERLGFLRRVQREFRTSIDLFGRAVAPIEDKWDALEPYAFSLAIENTVADDYWTEKVADCFLAWTCPIYHGAGNLSDFFPPESFIRIDIRRPREAIAIIQRVLDGGEADWRRRLPAIEEARELVMRRWQLFPHLVRQLRVASQEAGPMQEILIRGHRPRLRSSIRRRWQRYRGIFQSLFRNSA